MYLYLSIRMESYYTYSSANCSFFVIVCLCPAASTCLCNESVSQVRFAPELLEDQDPIGVNTPTRWKWQVPEAVPLGAPDWLVVPMRWGTGSFVAHEDQGFFPKLVSCFWRNTCSLKALAGIPTYPLRSVLLQKKKILEVFCFLRCFYVDHF